MLRFSLPVLDAVRRRERNASEDHFMLGSSSDFAVAAAAVPARIRERSNSDDAWTGGMSYSAAKAAVVGGDTSCVPASDKLMSELEAMFPAPTARRVIVNDVAGGAPNVAAFLSGSPLSMRRRAKTDSEFAPLAVVVNLVSSAMVSADDVRKRGVAILALVRALSGRRPVELWAGCTTQAKKNDGGHIYFRIDTAPLDLARAAFLLTHPAVSRHLGYAMAHHYYDAGTPGNLGWAYDNHGLSREHYAASVQRAFPGMSDVLAIPGVYGLDKAVSDPVAWIAEHVRTYGGEELGLATAA